MATQWNTSHTQLEGTEQENSSPGSGLRRNPWSEAGGGESPRGDVPSTATSSPVPREPPATPAALGQPSAFPSKPKAALRSPLFFYFPPQSAHFRSRSALGHHPFSLPQLCPSRKGLNVSATSSESWAFLRWDKFSSYSQQKIDEKHPKYAGSWFCSSKSHWQQRKEQDGTGSCPHCRLSWGRCPERRRNAGLDTLFHWGSTSWTKWALNNKKLDLELAIRFSTISSGKYTVRIPKN